MLATQDSQSLTAEILQKYQSEAQKIFMSIVKVRLNYWLQLNDER